jgi:hypothetical protein
MSAAIQPYERQLRLIADEFIDAVNARRARERLSISQSKPLARFQDYLVQLKACTTRAYEWLLEVNKLLLEVKQLIIITTLICVFACEVVGLMIKLDIYPF